MPELGVETWLAKPFWPWPLALAYSQKEEIWGAAFEAAAEVLTIYPQLAGYDHFSGSGAIHRVYEVTTGKAGTGRPEEHALQELEASLRSAIETGAVTAHGRRTRVSRLEPIQATDWVGAEIDGEATCDLVQVGWRAKSSAFDTLFDGAERIVWYYDVQLSRAELVAAFGPRFLPEHASHSEAWSEERMKEEIARCGIKNRDKAWRIIFKPISKVHRWDNTSFRDVWSAARGTKGTTGRPKKGA